MRTYSDFRGLQPLSPYLYLLLLSMCCSCCFCESNSKVEIPVHSISLSRVDTIYYHTQERPYSKGWPITVDVMDISNATDHTCIDCEKLDAVARYNDVLIVITNDSCLFEHTYRNDSLTLKYPKFQFCDFDEDYVMLHKGDTIVFLNNEDQTLSLIEASISSNDFSIGGLFVGMDEFELSKLLGFKTSCLRDINKVIILPNFYYTMAQNQIRHPRIPQYPPFYDRIILTYDNHIKDIKVTMVSCQENLLLGPDFVSSDVANDSSSMEDYDE